VLGSQLKRTLLRKDPTFSETNYGFRAFGELLRHLSQTGIIEMSEGTAKGDLEIDFASADSGEDAAFALVRDVIGDLASNRSPTVLSGLKNQIRKRDNSFSEKNFGYSSFLQFMKAARTRGVIQFDWDDKVDDYIVGV
jgi:hypothetical protein